MPSDAAAKLTAKMKNYEYRVPMGCYEDRRREELRSPCRIPKEPCHCDGAMMHENDIAEECCRGKSCVIDGAPLGMVYAQMQDFSDLLPEDTALYHGSLFNGLIFPFEASSCACKKANGGNYR